MVKITEERIDELVKSGKWSEVIEEINDELKKNDEVLHKRFDEAEDITGLKIVIAKDQEMRNMTLQKLAIQEYINYLELSSIRKDIKTIALAVKTIDKKDEPITKEVRDKLQELEERMEKIPKKRPLLSIGSLFNFGGVNATGADF